MNRICAISFLLIISCAHFGEARQKEEVSLDSALIAPRIYKLPDFSIYRNVKEKKKLFFDFLLPMVKEENAKLERDHKRIKNLSDAYQKQGSLAAKEMQWLSKMAKRFRLGPFTAKSKATWSELLNKVDVIPEALFLAQAANESAWGTSKFARVANNLFGQWCFTTGCGIVPVRRIKGETHEVQKFTTVNDAVATYVLHLNSHPVYQKLRDERRRLREAGKAPTGYALAVGLEKYSARGAEYVKEIRSMITFNKLDDTTN